MMLKYFPLFRLSDHFPRGEGEDDFSQVTKFPSLQQRIEHEVRKSLRTNILRVTNKMKHSACRF